jgi:spore germination cell wall hydrolase CwlJ-like protein
MGRPTGRRRTLTILVVATLCLAAILLALMIRLAFPDDFDGAAVGGRDARLTINLPTQPLPVVEPFEFLDLSQDQARQTNAAIPFVVGSNPAAAAFRFDGSPADLDRATDCLASAAYYEAGDDPVGARAVAQVVLNRVRHPAFPSTVCGVVFQGQERATGCQFTFTCDGALARRRPSEGAWARARALALNALHGSVFSAVGLATHYHTDWVVPYWSAKLDKLAEVNTHLFLRWRDGWGRPAAFTRRYAGDEPTIDRLAILSPAHGAAGGAVPLAVLPGSSVSSALPGGDMAQGSSPAVPLALLRTNRLVRDEAQQNVVIIALDPQAYSGSYALTAQSICAARGSSGCTVLGWFDAGQVPARLVATDVAKAGADFYYFSDPQRGREVALWNCARIKRDKDSQCL